MVRIVLEKKILGWIIAANPAEGELNTLKGREVVVAYVLILHSNPNRSAESFSSDFGGEPLTVEALPRPCSKEGSSGKGSGFRELSGWTSVCNSVGFLGHTTKKLTKRLSKH
jgi:hypothetical protein